MVELCCPLATFRLDFGCSWGLWLSSAGELHVSLSPGISGMERGFAFSRGSSAMMPGMETYAEVGSTSGHS